jgi:hypothetical protein
MDLVLLDVDVHKRGFISPHEFIDLFGGLHIPQVIYEGIFDAEFVQAVRDGHFPVDEGIVAKGGSGHELWRRKVKTSAYLTKLKTRFQDDWHKYWE